MTDEFMRRLMAKRDPQAASLAAFSAAKAADPVLAAMAAKLNQRAKELRPHGLAVVELLLAISSQTDRHQHQELTQFELIWSAAHALGVTDRDIAVCIGGFFGGDPAELPDNFSLYDL